MKRKKNRGSAVIEFTLLTPILFGCIYLYIVWFLFLIESGKRMEQLTEYIYQTEVAQDQHSSSEGIQFRKEGNTKEAGIDEQEGLFHIRLTIRKDENDPVKNIRRWQFVTDIF